MDKKLIEDIAGLLAPDSSLVKADNAIRAIGRELLKKAAGHEAKRKQIAEDIKRGTRLSRKQLPL